MTLKSDIEPLSQLNKQGSILYMYMTQTPSFIYTEKCKTNIKKCG